MLPIEQVKSLMKTLAKVQDTSAPVNYSYNGKVETLNYNAMNETLRKELNELCGTVPQWRENKYRLFSLIEETISEIVPTRALEKWGQFAEVRTFAQGDRPVFTRKMGHQRAKQFVTRVGLAGIYEVFKLGGESFEVQTSAIGAAAQIQFEEFLDGRADFAEVTNIIMDGLDEFIYREIAAALMTSINQLPPANRVAANGYVEKALDYLIQTASVYGKPTIYCTLEFAMKMIPETGWVSDAMKDQRWNQGYLGNYKGCSVIVLPQTFTDGDNAVKTIDPGYVWVIPAGADTKPVKVAFEGTAHIKERDNDDWSKDLHVYQKVGVGVMMTNTIFSYVDADLKGVLSNVNPSPNNN